MNTGSLKKNHTLHSKLNLIIPFIDIYSIKPKLTSDQCTYISFQWLNDDIIDDGTVLVHVLTYVKFRQYVLT